MMKADSIDISFMNFCGVLFLTLMNTMNVAWMSRFSFSSNALIHLPVCLHEIFCLWAMRPIASCHALKWNAAFHLSGALFENARSSNPGSSVLSFWLCIIPLVFNHVHIHLFHSFLFFLHIRKIITLKPLIQLTWGFFHDDPCHVYYFLVIFMKIVHVWISVLARVCSYMSFVAHCLLFCSWNNDA